jgi:uncharacterized glyoxalase superfamily protein PhnB
MQLSTVILHVPDDATLQACKEWYIRLGLTPSGEAPGESVFFATGEGMSLGVHIYSDAAPGSATVYLTVDDVDREYDRLLAASIDAEEAPQDRFWGRVLNLRDPAGHRIVLVTPPEA